MEVAVRHFRVWDGQRALEIALLRTFAVPGIGGLLATTGEFTQRTQRRYDDTALLTERRSRSYPDGYDVAALGPPECEPDGEHVGGQVGGRAVGAVS